MIKFKLGNMEIQPLTNRFENKIRSRIPSTIHLPQVRFDSFEGETNFYLLTSVGEVIFKDPKDIEEQWFESYNAWLGQCIINDSFHTACVIFFK